MNSEKNIYIYIDWRPRSIQIMDESQSVITINSMNSNDYTYCIQQNYEGSNQTETMKSVCVKEKVSESAGKTPNGEGKEFN